jgi:hypothetical protein
MKLKVWFDLCDDALSSKLGSADSVSLSKLHIEIKKTTFIIYLNTSIQLVVKDGDYDHQKRKEWWLVFDGSSNISKPQCMLSCLVDPDHWNRFIVTFQKDNHIQWKINLSDKQCDELYAEICHEFSMYSKLERKHTSITLPIEKFEKIIVIYVLHV